MNHPEGATTMETLRFQTNGSPVIRIESLGGRLQVRAWESTTVEISGEVPGELSATSENDEIRLSGSTDCQVFAPSAARIEASTVGGDVSIQGVTGDLLLRTVGGDLRLRDVGGVAVETVGGDLSARNLAGALSVDRAGGDAVVDEVQGDVRIPTVGGDLRISRVGGLVQAVAGGDARISISPKASTHSGVQAGGDLTCAVPEESSVRLSLTAGGDFHLAVPVEVKSTTTGCEVLLGEGQATVQLSAGGDLTLRTGIEGLGGIDIDLGGAIADRVGAEIEAHMAEIEGRIGSLGEKIGYFDSERIGRKIRETIARAQRKAARAQTRAASLRAEAGSSEPAPESSAQERIAVLRMLEEGKLTVSQAEELLQALEPRE